MYKTFGKTALTKKSYVTNCSVQSCLFFDKPLHFLINKYSGCCCKSHFAFFYTCQNVNLSKKGTFPKREAVFLVSLYIYRLAELSEFKLCLMCRPTYGIRMENYMWPEIKPCVALK